MGPDDLILSAHTVSSASFIERVEAAKAAHFAGIGMRLSDYRAALQARASNADLRAILDAHGVQIAEVEVLGGWALGGEKGVRSRRFEERLYEMVDALGGRHLIVHSELEGPVEQAAERFGSLCDRAAEHGLLVGIEFLPWTSIPDATTAWKIAGLADRVNGGVLVDSWHHFRGPADEDQLLAIPRDKVVAVHINDADERPVGSLLDDTLHRRRLPGDGAFPLVDFVRLLDGMGVRVPYSVEVISDELAGARPEEAARRAAGKTRQVLAQARG